MSSMSSVDVVLYGATGFTGKLAAKYLDKLQPSITWAIAGRNKDKLQAVHEELSSDPKMIVCDLGDQAAVDKMVAGARVVISTAGPYSQHNGRAILGSCARQGKGYTDLAGEGYWQRDMIKEFHDIAKKSGAKIVLGGGVDSIPSDLGVMLALASLEGRQEDTPVSISTVYTRFNGAFSGGTLASGKAGAAAKEGKLPGISPYTEEDQANPYLLCADVAEKGPRRDTGLGIDGWPIDWKKQIEPDFGGKVGNFFMAPVNCKIVRRSLALRSLTETVAYKECMAASAWTKVGLFYMSYGMGYLVCDPVNFKPKPGQGPPGWCVRNGGFTVEVRATNDSTNQQSKCLINGKGDPGYGATAKMIVETALCLLDADQPDMPKDTGVLTPSIALGSALIRRLEQADGGKFMSFTMTTGKSKRTVTPSAASPKAE